MRARDLLATAAVVAALVGVAIAVVPALGRVIVVPPIPVGVLGGLGVLFALFVAQRRTEYDRDAADVPTVESRTAAPRPGAGFDDQVATAAASLRRRAARRDVEDRLRAAAIDVLVATEGVDREAAADALDGGEWTDDRYAATLLAEDAGPPLRAIVYGFVGDESPLERQVRHAVAELRGRLEGP